jgi:peptidoglycan/xylan/chitin deacetylase (PgdA/CDA1 family)
MIIYDSLRKKVKKIIPKNLLIQRLDSRASNCVLLTFDDGPHPEITPAILKKLETYEARAIFFIPGRRIERAPYLLKRIQEKGHLIGNHTYIHSNGRQPWFGAYWRDLIRCQAIIEQCIGERPKIFRPAGGQISLTSLLVPLLMGLKTMGWSMEVDDWRLKTPLEAQEGAKHLANRIASRDIVLLHDSNPNVIQILDIILPMIQESKINLKSGINFI